jgi:ankyrin repeat protein
MVLLLSAEDKKIRGNTMGMDRFRNSLKSAANTLTQAIKSKVTTKRSRPELLRESIEKNQLDVFQTAFNESTDPKEFVTPDSEGNTLLKLAVDHGCAEMVSLILDKNPECLTMPDKKGNLLLHEAARAGQTNIVNLLLQKLEENHADEIGVNVQNRSGETLLHLAARGGHLELTKELVKAGAAIGTADYERNTPLHLAALNGKDNVVSYLVDYLQQHFHSQYGGGEHTELSKYVNAQNKAGNTPLHLAILRDRKTVAYALVRVGDADVTILNEEKETPLSLTDDEVFKKDLAILAKTRDTTEEGIIINKNISDELSRYLEKIKQEKLENEKNRT